MLRFNKLFSLQDEVVDYISKLSTEKKKDGILDVLKHHRVKIVGHERDGCILITRETTDTVVGSKPRTCIDLYDLRRRQFTNLYKHNAEPIDIVSCSVNEERTLIGYTIKRMVPSEKGIDQFYETFIGELNKGDFIPIIVRTTQPQRIQFLYTNDQPVEPSKKQMSYLLFFVNEEYIYFYQIPHKPKTEGGVKMSLPVKKAELSKNFAWCEYDTRKGLLYVIGLRSNKRESSDGYSLRCFSFPDRKPTLFEKEEKDVNLIYEIPLHVRLTNPLDPLNIYPLHSLGPSIQYQYMTIVHLRGNVCLCQQHKPTETTSIDVSIFIIPSRMKLDLALPITSVNSEKPIRVLFDTIADVLVVYVPNLYIQFVDCGQMHGPALSLALSGKESTIFSEGDDFPCLVPLDVLQKNDQLMLPDTKGHVVLDTVTGTAYELGLDRDTIFKLFDLYETFPGMDVDKSSLPDIYPPKPFADFHVQALHFVIIHLQDFDLLHRILMHLCTARPVNVTSALLAEYIVGITYVEIAKKIKQTTENPVERLLPISTLDLLSDYLQHSYARRINGNVKVSIMYGYTTHNKSKEIKDEERRFFLGPNSPQKLLKQSQLTVPGQSPPPGVKKFFRDFLGLNDELSRVLRLSEKQGDEEEEDAAHRRLFIESLSTHILNYFPKEKYNVHAISREYFKVQNTQINVLFNYILGSLSSRNDMMSFAIFEHFFAALEELSGPFPKGFNAEFMKLAFRCLPRGVFLQYVNRGIFSLDDPCVEDILKELEVSNLKEDEELRTHLLFKLTNQIPTKKCVETMKKFEDMSSVVIQNMVLQAMNTRNSHSGISASRESFLDMDYVDESPFIPLSAFLQLLKEDDTIDFQYIKNNSERSIEQAFRLPFKNSNSVKTGKEEE